MYSMDVVVRYSEIGMGGKIPLHQYLNYFQDCSTFHGEEIGAKVSGYLNRNRGWFLLAYNIEINQQPTLGDKLHIETEPYLFKGFFGYRRYWIYDEEGKQVAKADSLWIFMNIHDLTPVRCDEETKKAFIPEPVDETVHVKRKLSDKGEWEEKEKIEIRPFYLDSNVHVNNSYYCLWAQSYLPSDKMVKGIRIEYRKSSFEGDVLTLYIYQTEDMFRVKYVNQNQEVIAVIEMDLIEG